MTTNACANDMAETGSGAEIGPVREHAAKVGEGLTARL